MISIYNGQAGCHRRTVGMMNKISTWLPLAGMILGMAFESHAQTFTRKPFLQKNSPTKLSVCWRVSTAAVLTVKFGTDSTNLNRTSPASINATDACVSLDTLQPATKYFYEVYNGATKLTGSAKQYAVTAPVLGTRQKNSFLILGDPGSAGVPQTNVRNAFLRVNQGTLDGVLLNGDNAYESGTDAEFTTNLFTPYSNIFATSFVWPAIGNHEAVSSSTGAPYLASFYLPSAGESGGVASGSELYYSFDYSNIHFIILDSQVSPRTTTGAQYLWLLQDLQATRQDWIIAMWHHPPYSKSGHNSDTEQQLIDMRQNFLPLLEQYGVDLVFCGHSHDYERSYLLDSAYGNSANNQANAAKVILNNTSGNPATTGAYHKTIGAHKGAVYSVVGSSAKLDAGTLHPMMYVQHLLYGSFLLTVQDSVATGQFIDSAGIVRDQFQVVKALLAPLGISYPTLVYSAVNTPVNLTPAITGATGTLSYTLASGILPTGLILNTSTGVISGTPTVSGNATISIRVTSSPGGTFATSTPFTLTVLSPPAALTYSNPVALYPLNVFIPNNIPSVTGTVTHYSISPPLPDSLFLDTLTGVIGGKPKIDQVSTAYVVTASNVAGSDTETVRIAVLAKPVIAYNPSAVVDTVSKAATHPVISSGGPIIGCSVTSGTLPSGFTINNTCQVTGTASVTFPTISLVVTATNASGSDTANLKLTVVERPPTVVLVRPSVVIHRGEALIPDSVVMSGGPVTVFRVHVNDALPQGLILDSLTGIITGTVSVTATLETRTVTLDAIGPGGTVTLTFTVEVRVQLPVITLPHLGVIVTRRGVAMAPETLTVVTSGQTYYWRARAADPPPSGLVLDSLTGVLHGIIAASVPLGVRTVTVELVTPTDTVAVTFTVDVLPPLPVITIPHLGVIVTRRGVSMAPETLTVVTSGQTYYWRARAQDPPPSGLILDSLTGVLHGIIAASVPLGVRTVTVELVTPIDTVAVTFTVDVLPPLPVITIPHLGVIVTRRGVSMAPETLTVVTSGQTYYWRARAADPPPSGLVLDSLTGILHGIIAASVPLGVRTVTVELVTPTDTVVVTFTVDVLPPLPVITLPHLGVIVTRRGVSMAPETLTVVTSGQTYYWRARAADPPPSGLVLDSLTGVLHGIIAASVPLGVRTVTVDLVTPTDTVAVTFTVDVLPPLPVITIPHLGVIVTRRGVSMVPETLTVVTTGQTYYWRARAADPLPSGLLLDSLTGVLHGIVANTVPLGVRFVTVELVTPIDTVAVTFTVDVLPPLPVITIPHLGVIVTRRGVSMVPETLTVVTSGQTYYWRARAADPPPSGLVLDSLTGILHGIIAASVPLGVRTVTVELVTPTDTVAVTFTVDVLPPLPVITLPHLGVIVTRHGVSMAPETLTVVTSGQTYYWRARATDPPPSGLLLDSLTGVLHGIIAASVPLGVRTVTVELVTPTDTVVVTFTVDVREAPPVFSYLRSNIAALKDIPITPDTVVSTGGIVNVFHIFPVLPADLKLDTNTGIISGTPTIEGPLANYVIIGNNPSGSDTDTVFISVLPPPSNLAYPTPVLYGVGVAITPATPVVTGVVTRYSVNPALPAGLALDSITGILSGTPTGVNNPRDYTMTASNLAGFTTAIMNIRVVVAPANLSYVDDPTTYVLDVAITPNNPSVTGFVSKFSSVPSLPPGLKLDSITGVISGIPTGAQSFAANYTITAKNLAGQTQTAITTSIVGPPSNLSYADDAPTYGRNLAINPPNTPVVHGIVTFYSINPALPAGIMFDQTTGYILGTPTALSSPNNYTITALNPGGTAVTTINLGVINPP